MVGRVAGKIRRGGSAEGRKAVFERYAWLQLTGGMKVRMVQWRVADRSCHELFDTEWITKVHGKRSQRSACVRDGFRVLGSTARNERAQLSHIRSPFGLPPWHQSRHLTAAEIIYPNTGDKHRSSRGEEKASANTFDFPPFRVKTTKIVELSFARVDFLDIWRERSKVKKMVWKIFFKNTRFNMKILNLTSIDYRI